MISHQTPLSTMHLLIKQFFSNRQHSRSIFKVIDNSVLKQNSLHLKPTCQKSKSSMDDNAGKVNRVTSENKENFNPNSKATTSFGENFSGENTRTLLSKLNSNVCSKQGGKDNVDVLKELKLNKDAHRKTLPDKTEVHHGGYKHGAVTSHASRSNKEIPQSYVDAIKQLNTLQSNIRTIRESKLRKDPVEMQAVQVDQVVQYLGHLNITLDDIKKLNVIHISGTKGKGSTCAYCESILRSHGFSTGFFSSPHLIEVRERIKLNGEPISYDKFTKYFWTVYNALHAKRKHAEDMPAYFKFLTVMSFYVFVKEKPDAVIMEVGIGGRYDNTNIIPNTAVVGITSLGYDHTAVLGNTIEEITMQKAGIMKPNCIAVTSANQRGPCKRILLETSRALNCVLLEAPSILNYRWRGQPLDEDWKSTVQSINISLAIQLAYLWMFRMNKSAELKSVIDKFLAEMRVSSPNETPGGQGHLSSCETPGGQGHLSFSETPGGQGHPTGNLSSLPMGPHFEIDPKTYRGIKACVWPGRVQVIRKNNFKYFLDGAHTTDSIELCAKWFLRKSEAEANSTRSVSSCPLDPTQSKSSNVIQRILVFNVTGERDPTKLLSPLLQSNQFEYILVTPNILTNESSPDTQYGGNRTIDRFGVKLDSRTAAPNGGHEPGRPNVGQAGGGFQSRSGDNSIRSNANPLSSVDCHNVNDQSNSFHKIATVASALSQRSKVVEFSSVLDTYNFKYGLDPSKEYHILVTGSLHLVGAFLNVLSNYDSVSSKV